jgi:peptide deformylase
MTRLDILEHPDPRLRQRARPVVSFDRDLGVLIDDMLETVRGAGGIGLSATQVGDQRRVLVIDPDGGGQTARVFVNPEIEHKTRFGFVEESCLSVPGVVGNVVRATEVTVSAQDGHGARFQRRLAGMAAVSLQHEIDHLDGVLFIDRLSALEKLRMRLFAREHYRMARAALRAERRPAAPCAPGRRQGPRAPADA